jgi:hypothetical protein
VGIVSRVLRPDGEHQPTGATPVRSVRMQSRYRSS